MKKLLFTVLCLMMVYLIPNTSYGGTNYQSYEHIVVANGKLLEDFTSKDYTAYYKNVDKRQFSGWKVYKVHSNAKATYVSETLFSYYNDGYTPIDYKYKLDRKVNTKLGISASGTIGIKNQKGAAAFKNNLDASLKLSADYTRTSEDKETYEISLKVDPGTQVDLYVYGEAKVTNGVAARYLFWIRTERGGFELFLITTQYQRLEKKRI
ncbi:hypothetical protein [Peloplasma aerotolerans]|uniref:DUF3108 domain-containing protein n=1 Tax=Peloplasma aerotolerans TaxID=3044389 RepID=A0AAW6U607_9MOLU|nr:hypothetical protein [Mariniplasma sp. M4Ah]MDI6451977.1 hypothetical protein [Mariniplasma sp. M4Ah]MDR4968789.1 hypothetical protein [Acholeplasmataceae bacterium]